MRWRTNSDDESVVGMCGGDELLLNSHTNTIEIWHTVLLVKPECEWQWLEQHNFLFSVRIMISPSSPTVTLATIRNWSGREDTNMKFSRG
jgi:hypothetical protein